jgi:hypothetical protein
MLANNRLMIKTECTPQKPEFQVVKTEYRMHATEAGIRTETGEVGSGMWD